MIKFDLISNQFVNDSSVSSVDVEEAKQLVCNEIDSYASLLRSKVVGIVSPYEAASWAIKLGEAKAKSGPVLEMEAANRGVSVEELSAKVIAKYEAWHVVEAAIAGISGKHRDYVRSLNKTQEVLDYDWRQGWPF